MPVGTNSWVDLDSTNGRLQKPNNVVSSDNSQQAHEAPGSAQVSEVTIAGQIIKGAPNSGVLARGVTITSRAHFIAS